jgi:hypothetical protein
MQFLVSASTEAHLNEMIHVLTFTWNNLIKRLQTTCWLENMNPLKDVGNTHIQDLFLSLFSLMTAYL